MRLTDTTLAASKDVKTSVNTSEEESNSFRNDVRKRIAENAGLSGAYLLMNALAAIVASYGLLQDSVAVVIGAMIIAMLLGPITGLALALVDGERTLLKQAAVAEVSGVLLVLAIGFTIGKIHADLPLGHEITIRTSPNILDMIIALAGGAAGAYAVISPRLSASLVGVAVATALVPPLCTCGICLAHGLYREGGGAFVLFLTNFVAIQSVTSLVLWLTGFHRLSHLDRKAMIRRFGPSVALLVILAVFLFRSFLVALGQQTLHTTAEKLLRERIEKNGAARLTDLRLQGYGSQPVLTAVVNAPWVITPASCASLQMELRQVTKQQDLDLRVRTVITREASSSGYLWTDSTSNIPKPDTTTPDAAEPASSPAGAP